MQSEFIPDAGVIARICAELQELTAARLLPHAPALVPTPEVLASVVSTMFWTSLQREEGQIVTPRVVIADPAACDSPLLFRDARPFTEDVLAKLAPAFASPQTMLGVCPDPDGGLKIWGATWSRPMYSVVLRAAAPGVVVVDGYPITRFYFRGRTVCEVTAQLDPLIRPFGARRKENDEHFVTMGLAAAVRALRAHGRGGALLLVHAGTDGWKGAVQNKGWLEPGYVGLKAALGTKLWYVREVERREREEEDRGITESLRATGGDVHDAYLAHARVVGRFTAIDGAVVLSDDLVVHGLGVKIIAAAEPMTVLSLRPTAGASPEEVLYTATGGTRHQSAARFVFAVRDARAVVASQDGGLSVFAWDADRAIVVWHRDVDLLI